jgi:hypothetical protein
VSSDTVTSYREKSINVAWLPRVSGKPQLVPRFDPVVLDVDAFAFSYDTRRKGPIDDRKVIMVSGRF